MIFQSPRALLPPKRVRESNSFAAFSAGHETLICMGLWSATIPSDHFPRVSIWRISDTISLLLMHRCDSMLSSNRVEGLRRRLGEKRYEQICGIRDRARVVADRTSNC